MVPEDCIKAAFLDAVDEAQQLKHYLKIGEQLRYKDEQKNRDGNHHLENESVEYFRKKYDEDFDIQNHLENLGRVSTATYNHLAEEPFGTLLGAIETMVTLVHE